MARTAVRIQMNTANLRILTRSRTGPIGRDLDRRATRVTARMKANASGRPGPNLKTRNLYEAIGYLRLREDGDGLAADIGVQSHRMIRRGYNYALVLEGVIPRGGAPPSGAYPFMARSFDAARD